ncbi:hypothetical protein EOD42_24675 [Rhodovarius crocodyli]|uniref:Uncharacterized protein n=1 Tax=Rhodovarius crocodyli TaxID=1979269 RepID=A0A437LX57_9PROT|nr:hypothetical protein [Rhodovarius crocodyli]RVT89960.1 hypothetical protein EOD42_24675 [Rhodovarius crocodyli]
MGFSAAFMYFPVLPVLIVAAVMLGLLVLAFPLMLLLRWLMPRAWRCALPPRTLLPACMLAIPVLLMTALMGHAAMQPDREITVQKPSREEIRARQALFRHLLPGREAGRPTLPADQE